MRAGGPWRFDQCDVRSCADLASVALVTLQRADACLCECAVGGLEPVVMKEKTRLDTDEVVEMFGEPNSGVICYDDSWCVMLGCTLEHTGEGGAAVRFSESSGGLLESCLVQHNDVAVAFNDRVRCAVYSSLFQFNLKGAFYACEDVHQDAKIEIVDNTICRNSVLDFESYGVWLGERRPHCLTQRGNRENW